jgi:hypothetical protein
VTLTRDKGNFSHPGSLTVLKIRVARSTTLGCIDKLHIVSLGMSLQQRRRPKSYDPNFLIDALIDELNLKSDSELSDALELPPPVIFKIRYGRLPVGASLLVRMHEVSALSIRELRDLMGDRRAKYRGGGTL